MPSWCSIALSLRLLLLLVCGRFATLRSLSMAPGGDQNLTNEPGCGVVCAGVRERALRSVVVVTSLISSRFIPSPCRPHRPYNLFYTLFKKKYILKTNKKTNLDENQIVTRSLLLSHFKMHSFSPHLSLLTHVAPVPF